VPRRPALFGLLGGVLTAAGLAPFGWWALALVGMAVLVDTIGEHRRRGRLTIGLAYGAGLCLPGLWWMTEFSAPGYVLAALLEATMIGVVVALAPSGRFRYLGVPAALVLADALRGTWPWGGVPVATIAQTQVGGPLLGVARVGGPLLLTWVAGAAAVALLALVRRRVLLLLGAGAMVTAMVLLAAVAPDGHRVGSIDVAVVQGGGRRGTRAVTTSSVKVFQAHLAASEQVQVGTDLVLWPEDVVDVDEDVRETTYGDQLSGLAMDLDTTLVAGVVASKGDHFTNVAQVWTRDGSFGPTYEKNQRVPFGEFIPFRSLIEKVADVSAVPHDARIGKGPGILRTDAGDLGVVISYEVFFARRARAAIRAGGEVLLVPTNATSYSTTQMPALELDAARLRAVETGRAVVQAAPTGFSAVVDANGTVRSHSDLGRRQVLHAEVERRRGRTIYTVVGDLPALLAALATLGLARFLRRLLPGRSANWLRPTSTRA
jgi:apolipoprotein N-acyltransferase